MEEEFLGIAFNGFDSATVATLFVTILLLMVSALVSGAETAFFSLSHTDMREIKERKSSASQAIQNLLSDVDILLATILVVNNLVNICIVILTSNIIDSLFTFTRYEFLFKTVFVTFILLLFGEILPKVFAQTTPVSFASFASRPLLLLRKIFYPFSFVLVRASNSISEKASRRPELSLNELADAVDITHDPTKEEHGMLSEIINFGTTEVAEIMRPRVDITALPLTASYEKVKQIINESGFSRIPVYTEDIDEIKGTLFVKDLLPHINHDDFEWQRLIRKPYFVSEYKKINDLMEDFQRDRVHMAIIVDEYGSTLGLVTLEDIIEEVVGEISDESDSEEKLYTRLSESTYMFEAKIHIGDFERILDMDENAMDQIKGDAETLAGLMLEFKRDLPLKGDKFKWENITFVVESLEGRRIDKIRVKIDKSE